MSLENWILEVNRLLFKICGMSNLDFAADVDFVQMFQEDFSPKAAANQAVRSSY